MKYPWLSSLNLKSEDDVIRYMRMLIENKLSYHPDDNPEEVIFGEPEDKPTPEDILQMKRLHKEMWEVCVPWKIFTQNRELFREYCKV